MPDKKYERLTRSHRRRDKGFLPSLTTRSSLWLGEDHVLNIDSTSFSEEFKRFYFRDIQMILVRTTWRQTKWNLVLSVLLALCLADLLFAAAFGAWQIFVTMLAVIFGVPLLLNNILGATCDVQLQTAVQIEQLPSVSRVRQARRFLDRIQPFIAASQGRLTPEEVVARIREANGMSGSPPAPTGGVARGVATGPLNL